MAKFLLTLSADDTNILDENINIP